MKYYSAFIPLTLAFCAVGCLMCESTEYKITMNAEGKGGTLVTIMRNVQSGETDQAKQQKDFEQTIDSWKEDDYLLQRMRDGLYVKDRELAIEENVLVWKEKAIFSDLADIFKHDIRNDTLRFVLKASQTLVATNGTVQPAKDSTVVYWPLRAAKEIFLTTRENDFDPKSDFAARFRKYEKESK